MDRHRKSGLLLSPRDHCCFPQRRGGKIHLQTTVLVLENVDWRLKEMSGGRGEVWLYQQRMVCPGGFGDTILLEFSLVNV